MNAPQKSQIDHAPVPDRDALAGEYFETLPYEPYAVQEEALLAYFTADPDKTGGHGVLVCAPTGTGKTLIAEAAVYEALRAGTRMYYTTPLIALTDQKLDELRASAVRWGFSADQVGLVTGNRTVNPDAPVLVVVAEILLNRLLNPEKFSFDDVSCVVMDEFHSFNDYERGIVWELTLGLLPKSVRLLLLSATVGNSLEFTSWLRRSHGKNLQLVQGTERKVPLQYEWVEDDLLNDFAEKIAAGDDLSRRTPALMFCFSRSQCWTTAEMLKGKSLIDKSRQKELADILNEADFSTGVGPKLKQILMRGVGVHHAGVLPRYRRIVEELFQQKLLSICVCTETLAAGINLPARSVVLPCLLKGPKTKRKLVESAAAHQIFGRAGRPQFDDRGYVFALAHEDDVKLHRWREKFDQIPEDTKDPGLMRARKQLKKKMPKRRAGETYWTQTQFEQLQIAKSADLVSRGRLPWRLLAYLILKDNQIAPIRDLVGRRLMHAGGIEVAQKDLNRMLITLHNSDAVILDPPPRALKVKTPVDKGPQKPGDLVRALEAEAAPPPATRGLFGELLDNMRPSDQHGSENGEDNELDAKIVDEQANITKHGYELEDYRPITATPRNRLERIVQLKSMNPLFGVFVADHLAMADDEERIAVIESVLDVPGTVARHTRMPKLEDMPPGTLATTYLDPLLLQRGLASPEELGGARDEEEEEVRDKGFGRVMFEEPRVWPLTIGEKLLRLFRDDYPRVDDVRVQPVWIVGELLQFGGDFDKYVVTRKLQKEEGILFRHCLRMILLLDELANIPPENTTVETWEDWLDDLADRLTETCRSIDPQSTDEMLENPAAHTEELSLPSGRRNQRRE
ncbi:DEAD/DEAH box helicase [Allorhodopirellula heiligendammensis]|uniref:Ski2-like helicase n=1 Tax=Allorhodopirellula heiligendammensis TaxID=2714739 RepID=A0A5C6BW77_9BACT|nr:DEAD/DEAH box helicase [Allorhodopirellula heiligendammensis]TWU16540.1 ski2-like helicase [Allorhodopirellula heiligendammensis]